jgi:Dna[CI] antecedent, DciA
LFLLCIAAPALVKVPYSTVTQALSRDPRYQALQDQLAKLSALQDTLDEQWPQMRLKVRSLKDGNLSLTASSAAQAARLRQIEPSLLRALQTREGEVTRISFKPQTRNSAQHTIPSEPKSISAKTLKVISEQEGLITHPAILAALAHIKKRARVRE